MMSNELSHCWSKEIRRQIETKNQKATRSNTERAECPKKTKTYGNKKRYRRRQTLLRVCGEGRELEKPSNRACLK